MADLTFAITFLCMVGLAYFIWNPYKQGDQFESISKQKFIIYYVFLSLFDIGVGLVLAQSAVYLARTFKKLSDGKTNSCLLMWHIVNVFTTAAIWLIVVIARMRVE